MAKRDGSGRRLSNEQMANLHAAMVTIMWDCPLCGARWIKWWTDYGRVPR